jgi:hypothetical protein
MCIYPLGESKINKRWERKMDSMKNKRGSGG